jgi:CHAT domain-containing protein
MAAAPQGVSEAGALPVLHLSCHGHHTWRDPPDEVPRPVLMLEDGAFGQRLPDARALLRALRPAMPRLLFLSACLTATAPGRETDPRAHESKEPDGGPGPTVGESPAHALSSALIQA